MYKIVRVYENNYRKRTIITGLTREEASLHCNNPETSSATCKLPHNIRRTKQLGAWFDTYERQ